MQRRKIIVQRLCAADELDSAVLAQEEFGAVELAVVVEPHRAAVRPRVVNDDDVADADLWRSACRCPSYAEPSRRASPHPP